MCRIKFGIIGWCLVFASMTIYGQRDLTPGKKSDAFGKVDYNTYRYSGLQISAGPTYMFTKKRNPVQTAYDAPRPTEYINDPEGDVGVFAEIGMLHIPKKRSKLSQRLKYIFVSYWDWGVGFKLLRGHEATQVHLFDNSGTQIASGDYAGSFRNGYLFGRITAHKNIYFKKKYFIDNGIGLNIDYNILRDNEASEYTTEMQALISPNIHKFHNPLVAQVHYNLGFGIELNRRSMLILGARVPIFGIQEWRNGFTDLKWFNSNYLPALFYVKWTRLFKKRAKDCAPARVNGQDQKTMNN